MSWLTIILQSLLVLYFVFSSIAKMAGAKFWVETFDHLKLSQGFRAFTGFVQLVGAIGLIIGYWYSGMIGWASVLLGITMLVACLAHIKVKDSFSKIVPALLFAVINIILIFITAGDMIHPFS